MSKRENYEKKTETLLMPILDEFQFDLWDVEYLKEGANWYLRVYIDKPGGIQIEDCEAVSRRLSDLLDEEDFIDDAYILEVSSPGLTRPLRRERDFQKSIGREVEVRTYRPIAKSKEFYGVLRNYDTETVTIQSEDGNLIEFKMQDIALIRLAFVF